MCGRAGKEAVFRALYTASFRVARPKISLCLDRATEGTRGLLQGAMTANLFACRSEQGPPMNFQNSSSVPPVGEPAHQLRFVSLFDPGRGMSVPCDAKGRVNMDDLTERLKNAYLGARALVGREYAFPTVELLH
jgi:hypothetical protein